MITILWIAVVAALAVGVVLALKYAAEAQKSPEVGKSANHEAVAGHVRE